MITYWLGEKFCWWKFVSLAVYSLDFLWRDGLVGTCLDTDVLRCCKWTHLLGIALLTFILNCRHLFFRHERFSCRERITFMQTPLFYKHLDADHLTEKIIHCRSQVTGTKRHYLKSFQSFHQGLYCPALSHSRGRQEVDVGFNLLKIQQLIFCLVIYNRWFWVAFLGANMFEIHRGQTVSFIHQRGGTLRIHCVSDWLRNLVPFPQSAI